MTEKPILFSGEMVRAILDGRKRQTRRIVKSSEGCRELKIVRERRGALYREVKKTFCRGWTSSGTTIQAVDFMPLVQPGETLWVRETWGDRADYAAIGQMHKDRIYYAADGRKDGWKYRPSIHMPRWACRLRLNVTGVRVERLQDISEEDARAEGVEKLADGYIVPGSVPVERRTLGYVDFFKHLWDKINGPESWAANPWVWVYEFGRKEEVLG